MYGLYPDNTKAVHDWISEGKNATGYNYTFVPANENFITRLNEKSCPLYNVVHNDVLSSAAWKDARLYYYNTYNKNLGKLVNNTGNITKDYFDDSCEYFFFSQYDPSLLLKFKPKDFDKAYCGAWLNGWIYETCLAMDIEWQLISYQFMK